MPKKDEFFNGFDNDIIDPDEFEEESETEEEDEEDVEDDGKSETEDDSKTEEEDSNTSEETEENAKTPEELEEEKKKQELHEKNEREKAKRLERERKEREEKIKNDAKLEAELSLVKKNTFTGEEIKDESDLEIFKIMQEIENNGGDPVQDLPKELAKRNRIAKEEAKKKAEEETKLNEEINGFHERHKEISKEELVKDGFLDVVDSEKYKGWSYAERVFDFVKNRDAAKKKSDEEKENEVINSNSKKMTKVPSSNSNGGKPGDVDYMDMSDEEYLKREKEESLDFFS